MQKLIISSIWGLALLGTIQAAQATDILNQDEVAHELTITEGDVVRTVELAAMGDIRDVCSGCTITLEDGQTLTAKENDIIAIVDGKLIADE